LVSRIPTVGKSSDYHLPLNLRGVKYERVRVTREESRMNDRWLTTGDVSEVTGIHPNTFDRWVTAGLLGPAGSGRGPGRHRRYTESEVLAVAVGMRYRGLGADDGRVAGVVKYLAGVSPEQLEAHLNDGRTFVVPEMLLRRVAAAEGIPYCGTLPGTMTEPPDDPALSPQAKALIKRLDVKAIRAEVMRKLAALARRPAPTGRGRRRGLAKRVSGD
jgi:hypothetical protein